MSTRVEIERQRDGWWLIRLYQGDSTTPVQLEARETRREARRCAKKMLRHWLKPKPPSREVITEQDL